MKIITKQSSFVVLAITLLALILTSCKSDKTDCGAVTKHTNIPEGYYVETIPYSVFKGIFDERIQYENIVSRGAAIPIKTEAQFYIKAWNDLFIQKLIEPEIEYLGLRVSDYEIDDMVFGAHPHSNLTSMPFLCDANGVYQPEEAKRFVELIKSDTAGDPKITWDVFVKDMVYEHQIKKMRSIVSSSFFVSPAEEKFYDKYLSTEIDFDYIFIPYTEAQITPSHDSLLVKLYEDYQEDYYKQETRDVTIVTIKPEVDSANHIEELKRFEALKNFADSDFRTLADKNESIKFYSADYNLNTTQKELLGFFENGKVGDLRGPYLQDNSYRLMKIIEKYTAPDSVKVRHIMLRGEDTSLVVELMKKINDNKDVFGKLAEKYSADTRSNENGGEIGWIKPGDLVEPYNTACFSAPSDFYFEIESHNKRHIMHVMETSQTSQSHVIVDVLYMDVEPNDRDIERMKKKANSISKKSKTGDDLLVKAVENRYATTNLNLVNTYYFLNDIPNSIDMLQWCFKNTINTVSPPFFRDNLAYILTVTDIVPTGYIPFEKVRDIVRDDYIVLYRKDTLYNRIAQRVKKGDTLEENGNILKREVIGIKNMLLSSYTIPTLGIEYNLRGVLMGLKVGKTSDLFKGDKGVFMVRKTAERKIKQTMDSETRLNNQFMANVSNDIYLGDITKKAYPIINIAREQDSYMLLKEYNDELPYDSTASKEIIPAEYAFRDENWALALNGNSDFKGFVNFYENIEKETKQSRLAKIYAGICFMKLNENQKAIQVLSTIGKTEDFYTPSIIPILLGDAYSFIGKNQEAIDSYKRAIDNSNSPFFSGIAMHKLALLDYMLGNYDEAIKYCEILINTNIKHFNSQVMTELLGALKEKKKNNN
ncbi:MAG: peptidylprolyl isomerase [Salinivirgaceae bacterium]|jgi:peptidyl-prolyl cis-trans isomerase D|nr:hypothetical protein [Bacteroidales bacterium]